MAYTGVVDLFDADGKVKAEKLPTSQTATVTKESVEAVLTGEISSHYHSPIITVSATEPSNPAVGQIWIDIS